MDKKVIGAILIVSAIVLGIVGYNKSQPTGLESFASGLGGFAASIAGNSTKGKRMQKNIENIKSEQLKRGLPFYIIGFIAGVAGIVLLVQSGKEVG